MGTIIIVLSEAALELARDYSLIPSDALVINVRDMATERPHYYGDSPSAEILRARGEPVAQYVMRWPGDDEFWNEVCGCGTLSGMV